MAKIRTIYIISGIIGTVFFLFLIVLRLVDAIKLGSLIVLSVVVLVIVIGIDLFVSFRRYKPFQQRNIQANKEPISYAEIENIFSINFDIDEIINFENIGTIKSEVLKKIGVE